MVLGRGKECRLTSPWPRNPPRLLMTPQRDAGWLDGAAPLDAAEGPRRALAARAYPPPSLLGAFPSRPQGVRGKTRGWESGGRTLLAAAGQRRVGKRHEEGQGKKRCKARGKRMRRVVEKRVSAENQHDPGGKRNPRFFKVCLASSSKPAQRHFQETAGAVGSAPRTGVSSRRPGGF